MPGWATDMVGVFLGAVLGGLFGYAATAHHDRTQTKARRRALLDALAGQLAAIPDVEPLNRVTTFPPVVITPLAHLLSGDVLDAVKDADLIVDLHWLESQVQTINEGIRTHNIAMATSSAHVLGQRSEHTDQSYTMFLSARDLALQRLKVAAEKEHRA